MGDKGFGILAVEVYFPILAVEQSALEVADNVSGKYTLGLGQDSMSFISDQEDVVSMGMTVISQLLEKHKVSPAEIGRMEIGTESSFDRSKSVKSHLLQAFTDAHNFTVEGCDSVHGCYGGTCAVFNALSWLESSAWDGRLALVVAVDVALYPPGSAACATGGCGAVAILLGPHAPLLAEPALTWRGVYAAHAWDFCKPLSGGLFPAMDARATLAWYMRSLDGAAAALARRQGGTATQGGGLLGQVDFFVAHAPFNRLVRKALGRLMLLDVLRSAHVEAAAAAAGLQLPEGLSGADVDADGALPERWLLDRELEQTLMAASADVYQQKAEDGCWLQQRVGNTYTACLWVGLAGLLARRGAELAGRRLLLFSFGSGAMAALFALRGADAPPEGGDPRFTLQALAAKSDVASRLAARRLVSPEEFRQLTAGFEASNSAAPFTPSAPDVARTTWPHAARLLRVDEQHRRHYAPPLTAQHTTQG